MRIWSTAITAVVMSVSVVADADDNHSYIDEAVKDLPLFEAHIHFKEPAWGPYPLEVVVKLMDENAVAMGLVSSHRTKELSCYGNTHRSGSNLNCGPTTGSPIPRIGRVPGTFDYLKWRLEKYPHVGISEFHLHQVPKDKMLFKKIAAEAIELDLYIHIYSGKAPVDFLFALEPRLKIIWAHAGMSEPADVVEAMMARYPKLYVDTSYRELDILNEDGTIDPDWRRVL